jgi:hypothetical protein
MSVRSLINQYRGVNAHLHSSFQVQGGWDSFHANYIADLGEFINDHLPPGYIVDIERSLQIREFHPDTGERLIQRRRPDVTIYQTDPARLPVIEVLPGGAVATLTQPVSETLTLTDEMFYAGLVIYEQQDDQSFGRPVTRIEVLSPSNKPPGDGFLQYIQKRYGALKSGLRLVEIDYLHETESPIKGIPRYPDQIDSFPYSITVSDPIPSLDEGRSETHEFAVDQPIPAIAIPLAGDERLSIDFGAVYNRTFRKLRAYSYLVDYERLPHRFERYSPADQERIKRRIDSVLRAHREGRNLEEGPFQLADQ